MSRERRPEAGRRCAEKLATLASGAVSFVGQASPQNEIERRHEPHGGLPSPAKQR